MDKKLLEKAAQSKTRFKDVMSLRKAKEYDKIFEQYGQRIYNLAVPSSHRKAEIKTLLEQGRFEDIYFKHGKNAYDDNIYKMQAMDVYNETGSKPKSILNRIKNVVKHRIAPVFLSTMLLAPPVTGTVLDSGVKKFKTENAIIYAQELENYNKKIETYASEVKSMNLTDIQTFMKVMSDMWKEIDGYATPENDIMGFLRLTLDGEGKGVCRHFADDVTAKLNEINPEYNARNITVYMSENEYNLANIDRTILETNETVAEKNSEESLVQEENTIDFTKYAGNHMVTVVDVPDQNVSLVLDPTNPGIGVFKDGKVYMFSTPDGKGIETKSLGQFVLNGAEEFFDLNKTKLESFLVSDKTLEELKNIYGTEAQNEALAYLDSLEEKKSLEAMKDDSFIPKVTVDEKTVIKEMQERQANLANEKQENNIDLSDR